MHRQSIARSPRAFKMPATATWSTWRHNLMGSFAMALLIGGFGTWSVMADISGAIVSSGRVAVDSNRQVVQHPNGGIVLDIAVREGDMVAEGDLLVRLDPQDMQAEVDLLQGQVVEIDARSARLEAQRDLASAIVFPGNLIALSKEDPVTAEAMAGQVSLFAAGKNSKEAEKNQLAKRREQILSQIEGTEAERRSIDSQIVFMREELETQRTLMEKGLSQAPKTLALQREEASMMGRAGSLAATRAELEGKATELDLELLRIDTVTREAAITELREIQFQKSGLVRQIAGLSSRLARLDITAPVAGVIYDMKVFAVRSVIPPGAPILHIVPQDRPLVVQARVKPTQVDSVHPGQVVKMRLPAFDARTTPEIDGRIVKVSPDAFTEEANGDTYYQAEIVPLDGEIDRLGDLVLLPGMPVESFITTQARSPLAYLAKPLTDYFTRAMRE